MKKTQATCVLLLLLSSLLIVETAIFGSFHRRRHRRSSEKVTEGPVFLLILSSLGNFVLGKDPTFWSHFIATQLNIIYLDKWRMGSQFLLYATCPSPDLRKIPQCCPYRAFKLKFPNNKKIGQ